MKITHRRNALGMIVGLAIFFLAITELNNLCASLLWGTGEADRVREIWSFMNWHWHLTAGAWYNMMMLALGLGLVVFGFSLWFWEN